MPLKWGRVVPVETFDITCAAGVQLERLGGAKRTNRARQVVVPLARIGVAFLVVERVARKQLQPFLGLEQ